MDFHDTGMFTCTKLTERSRVGITEVPLYILALQTLHMAYKEDPP